MQAKKRGLAPRSSHKLIDASNKERDCSILNKHLYLPHCSIKDVQCYHVCFGTLYTEDSLQYSNMHLYLLHFVVKVAQCSHILFHKLCRDSFHKLISALLNIKSCTMLSCLFSQASNRGLFPFFAHKLIFDPWHRKSFTVLASLFKEAV